MKKMLAICAVALFVFACNSSSAPAVEGETATTEQSAVCPEAKKCCKKDSTACCKKDSTACCKKDSTACCKAKKECKEEKK